ncbi:hydantoinase/carbamoylase family amidase [Elioraea sp.]|uniref:hydantoinase/carbamoylase family amidase n=1 Tax=Elioraea sp. TaxID=2185103 RepID=UPI0025C15CDB|nr:hydantoinase/carbamoylase family amidase [Elioraea sp.]
MAAEQDLRLSGARALGLAEAFLATLAERSADAPGVTRASFGAGERMAHAEARAVAEGLGLVVTTDAIGTLMMTLPGRDPSLPAGVIGSHLDSVRHGGNYDGAAGVAMGLALAARLVHAGAQPARDLVILGIRAEEMVWFPAHYLGSRAAFGVLPADAPDTLRRTDTGRTLADHMAEEGFDPDFVRARSASLDPGRIAWFIEPHIEQGPALVEAALPVGIVTGIRGSIRYRNCRAIGQDAHAGAVPRGFRHDAVLAAARLAAGLDRFWDQEEARGSDLVLTIGEFWTDPARHAPTRIPGEVRFTLDIRSEDDAVLDRARAHLDAAIAGERRVKIDLGPGMRATPALMDRAIQAALHAAAASRGVTVMPMASGAGHDCATFAGLGIPSGMVFIRNENGSHNPDEAMAMEDFAAAFSVMAAATDRLLGVS